MAKLVCVLYVDPIDGYPKAYRGNLLKIDLYPGGESVPAPGSERTADRKPIFIPNPDLALP